MKKLIQLIATILIFIQYNYSQCPEFTGSTMTPSCGATCNFCLGQSFTLKIQGGDLPNGGKVDFYIDETAGFDPYAGQGTKIGSSNISTGNPPCRICPVFVGFMIDACGPEANNEFAVWWSGSGFNTSNVNIDFDANNNGGAGNGDIGSACGVQAGNPALIGGCTAIAAGSGFNVPANSMYVLFTGNSPTTTYDFSGICDQVCAVYVSKSACARTIGAFSNNPSTGLRTQTFSITGCGCPSTTVIYDTDDPGLLGDGDSWNGGLTNDGCTFSGSGGSYTSVTSVVTDFSFMIPDTWCDKTYELVGILNPKSSSSCCMDIYTDRYTLDIRCPKAKTASLEQCELAGGQAKFDLSEIEQDVLNGSNGMIEWYRDMAGTIKITSPFTSGTATIYARIIDGDCKSNIVPIMLKVNLLPIARPAFLEACDEGGGRATFDLTKMIKIINNNNSNLTVKFYSDNNLSNEIFSPFETNTTTIYATVSDAKCESKPVDIRLVVLDKPTAKDVTSKICDNGDSTGTFDLNSLIPLVADGKTGITVNFYQDFDLNLKININPYITKTTTIYAQVFNGKCYSDKVEISLVVSNLTTIPLVSDKICEDGFGFGIFDLINITQQLQNGDTTIIVKYVSDTSTLSPVTLPVIVDKKDTIYARICKGICISNFIPIILEAIQRPTATAYTWRLCADANGKASFDLNLISSIINQGKGLFVGYSRDSLLKSLIGNKVIYTSSDTLYAFTLDGTCNSLPVRIILIAEPSPSINPKKDTTVCYNFILDPISGSFLNMPKYFTDITMSNTLKVGDTIKQSQSLYMIDVKGNCRDLDSFRITINTPQTAGLDNALSVCEGSIIDLVTILKNADTGGAFIDIDNSGSLNGNLFDSKGKNGSSFKFNYIQSNAAPCNPDTALLTINVVRSVEAGLDTTITICEGQIVDLISLLRYADAGGKFTHVNNSPALIGTTWNSSISGPGNFDINHEIGDGIICPKDFSKIKIIVQAQININQPKDVTSCGYYILPQITGKNIINNAGYFELMNGNGNKYLVGDTVKTSTKLFIYASDPNFCSDEKYFTITINNNIVSQLILNNLCPDQKRLVGSTIFDINNPVGTVKFTNVNNTGCDSIVSVNLSFINPIISNYNVSICSNEFITLNGNRYDRNKTKGTEVLKNASIAGCDSTVNINLSILPIINSSYTKQLCSGQNIVLNGKKYDQNNSSGIDTLHNASQFGCDSIVAITIQVVQAQKYIRRDSICNKANITIAGKVFDINNTPYLDTLRGGSSGGCDSIVDIILYFYKNNVDTFRRQLCNNDSLKINNKVYNSQNPKGTEIFQSTKSCDSTVIIDLNFKPKVTSIYNRQLCKGSFEIINGKRYDETNSTGIETLSGASTDGCDSIINVKLTFKNAVTYNYRNAICPGESIVINGNRYDQNKLSGIETLAGSASGGCDSIIDVLLSIKAISKPGTFAKQICENDFIIINGKRYDKNNKTGFDTLRNGSANGCDSIVQISINYSNYTLTYQKDYFANIGDLLKFNITTNINSPKTKWIPDAGLSCIDCIDPNYIVSGVSQLKFEIIDSIGCSIFGSINIYLKKDDDIFVPNSFSPNYDNTNDHFKIISSNPNYLINSFQIYDRWGEKIYEEKDATIANHIGWNGEYHGAKINPGVYVYYIEVITSTGKKIKLYGDITLLR